MVEVTTALRPVLKGHGIRTVENCCCVRAPGGLNEGLHYSYMTWGYNLKCPHKLWLTS